MIFKEIWNLVFGNLEKRESYPQVRMGDKKEIKLLKRKLLRDFTKSFGRENKSGS